MGFFDAYRSRRTELTGRESVATLDHMEDFFQDGANWTQDMYQNANGARCLVGAANHARVSSVDDAKHWLRQAIAEVAPGTRRIEDFNDGCRTYEEVAAVIARAKELACNARTQSRPAPVVELLPAPVRAALPAPAKPAPAKAGAEFLPARRSLGEGGPPAPRPAPPVIDMRPYVESMNRIQTALQKAERRRRNLAGWIMD